MQPLPSSSEARVDLNLPLAASRRGLAATRAALTARGIDARSLTPQSTIKDVLEKVLASIYGKSVPLPGTRASR